MSMSMSMSIPPNNINSPSSLEQRLLESLESRRLKGTIRSLEKQAQDRNKKIIDFSSNDYLGLSRCAKQISYVNQTYLQHITQQANVLGATGSRLLSGNHSSVEDLESYLAKVHNRSCTLLFNSGYDANLSLLGCIPRKNDVVFMDALSHNSLFTGLKLSRLVEGGGERSVKTFLHNDVNDLERLLIQSYNDDGDCSSSMQRLIVVESVYSMDGDISPLQEICTLANKYNAYVICDEAHALGVFGANGTGMLSLLKLENHPNVLCSIHTFGKAAGCHGAIIACSSTTLKEYLVNYARPFIYSTALPLHSIVSIRCAYHCITGLEGVYKRTQLKELISFFRREMESLNRKYDYENGIQTLNSPSPIQAVIIPGNQFCVQVASRMKDMGFNVYPIRAPTVPIGFERIRIILHSHNSTKEVKALVDCLDSVVQMVRSAGTTSNLLSKL